MDPRAPSASSQPGAQSRTRPDALLRPTQLPVAVPRKITYVFRATTSSNLRIPYAVAVDGVVRADFAQRAAQVRGSGGRITIHAASGSVVSLYLNSDAHPSFRTQPVYAVRVADRDVEVVITEKPGRHADVDTPLPRPAPSGGKPPEMDRYTAVLTGDIWMKVSHKYTEAEAEARIPTGTSPAVAQAVKSIYRGLSRPRLEIVEPMTDGEPRRLTVEFVDSVNPRNNITRYDLLSDGLPRVHPAGFAALFASALQQGISSIRVTSCWRPMLGSIAHRAGLGLDVDLVGGTRINRQELRAAIENKTRQGNRNDNDNVSEAEIQAFGRLEDAIEANKKARAELIAADKAREAAKKSGNAEAIQAAEAKFRQASARAKEAAEAERDARKAWNAARDACEPEHVRRFRTALLRCRCVKQLFDPWYMDANTHDEEPPEPNMQQGPATSNERLHAHHLHITVDEPGLL